MKLNYDVTPHQRRTTLSLETYPIITALYQIGEKLTKMLP